MSYPIPRKVETCQIRVKSQFMSQINKLNLEILFWLTRKLKIVIVVPRAAITKYHELGGLNNRKLLSHSSGGCKSILNVSVGLVPSEGYE